MLSSNWVQNENFREWMFDNIINENFLEIEVVFSSVIQNVIVSLNTE